MPIDPSQVTWDAPASTSIDPSQVTWDAPPSDEQGEAQSAAAQAQGGLLLQMGTGAVGQVAGGLAGIAQGIKNLVQNDPTNMSAADRVRQVGGALTYQPRTAAEGSLSGVVGDVATAIGNKQQALLEKAGAGPGITTAVPAIEQGLATVLPFVPKGLRVAGITSEAAAPAAEAAAETTSSAEAAAAPAAQSAPSAAEAPIADAGVQAQRAATLKSVGLTQARESAITGDKGAAATDYQTSKVDSEAGNAAKETFANERETLGNFSDQLVNDAGGTTGLDETALHNRGQTILQPLQDLQDHYNNQIKALYAQADAQAKGAPLYLDGTNDFLQNNRSAFTGTMEGNQLLRGINGRLREMGLLDDDGSISGASVQQAEQIKQYLNNQWTPRTGRLIAQVKDAIDDDVTKAAGGDVYQAARQARADRAAVLDNPTGIASLLDSSGPQGINRAVNVERVPDTVARMPTDQFGHVVDTLKQAAAVPGIAPQAQAALGEIRSQFALRLQEQGQKLKGAWNNKAVTQYLANNSTKLARVFTPEELQRMATLRDAGNILDVDRSYPGAAAQQHNLALRGVMSGVQHGAEAAGAHLAGPPGAVVGAMAGKALAKSIGARASRRAWQNRLRVL